MNNKNYILPVIILIVPLLLIIGYFSKPKTPFVNLDEFAKCLNQKGIVMYGANWCPHCQNEKKAFGKSFSFVNYVECPENPQRCLAAKIDGYPTWIFPDGRRLIGEQGIENLARESGCPVNQR